MVKLFVANTVKDLILGDIYEHLPIDRIPLVGKVIGLGTTNLFDNGELVFQWHSSQNHTQICHCRAETGRISQLDPGSELIHFPFVCFTDNATAVEAEVDLRSLVPSSQIKTAIAQGLQQIKPGYDYYGIRMRVRWRQLFISVASKLCFWQGRKFSDQQQGNEGLYQQLTQYCFAKQDPGVPPAKWLGSDLEWEVSGFYTHCPEQGLVTMPDPGNPLHLHGYSTNGQYGGHILDALSELEEILSFQIYPIAEVTVLESNLCLKDAKIQDQQLSFAVCNLGQLNTENVDVDVVFDNNYRRRLWQRIPFLRSGSQVSLRFPLVKEMLQPTGGTIQIVIDPNNTILESREGDNSLSLSYPAIVD